MADHCRSCEAEVIRAVTINGKEMPVDREPNPEKGNLVLLRTTTERPLALSFSNLNEQAREAVKRWGVPLFVSHFFTCPDADRWRKT